MIEKGWIKPEEPIHYPEKEDIAPSTPDYLHWIIDFPGLHFGKIAFLNGILVGVLLCYTQVDNCQGLLSNMAVAPQHRRKGIGSSLMKEVISFYKQKSGVDRIELGVSITNNIALKFYLEHDFKITKLRDIGHTMHYTLTN